MFVSDCYNVNEKGHLTISDCDTVELAEKYGTALYVMSEDEIRSVCRRYKSSFERHYNGKGTALYASKAFCCKEICRIVTEEGLDLDVVSGGELYTALAAGVDAKHIHFHGNNKTMQELRYALESGVGDIVVDNLNELHRIEKLSAEKGVVTSISMRIKPGIDAHTHEFIRTGQIDSKFGFALENGEAFEAVKEAVACENVELIGLHCHIGSQIFDKAPFVLAAQVMLKFYNKIHTELGKTLTHLNLGGGFGVKYKEADAAVPYEDYMSDVSEAVHAACKEYGIQVPYIYIFTLSRDAPSSVQATGLTRVTPSAISRPSRMCAYAMLAGGGGMYENPRYALYQSDYTCLIANKANEPADFTATIAGKCCESGDLIQENTLIQKPEVGDILAVLSAAVRRNYSMASNYNRITRVRRSSWFTAENPVSSSKGRPMKTSCVTMCDFTHCCAKIS
ncbi:diaminopimelate decarboxylase [Hominenteromicrobium sp.]|uniref:diaminopimelate decarboxylase n=1 Tax=Hominenteromicrobium sp. TaxID=3073581 RepID=UPI00399977F3